MLVVLAVAVGFAAAWASFRLGWIAGRRHAEDSIARLLRELGTPKQVIDLAREERRAPAR